MSARKSKKTAPAGEPKQPVLATAEQLFARYMKTIGKVRTLSHKLALEVAVTQRLAYELANRHGVYVSGKPPANKTQPAPQPLRNAGDVDFAGRHTTAILEEAPTEEPAPEEGEEYKPPTQGPSTAPAVRLSAKESEAIAKIRRDAGLSPEEAADAEALEAAGGPGQLARMQKAMGGRPAVIPSPGGLTGVPAGAPDPGPDNREGGPVRQGPVEEEE